MDVQGGQTEVHTHVHIGESTMDVQGGQTEVHAAVEDEEEVRGGDDPGDGTGEALLDPGFPGLPFDIADMSKTYGPSQRGAVAPKQYEAGARIMTETAKIWVAASLPKLDPDAAEWEREAAGEHSRFFLGTGATETPPYPVCPPELCPPFKGGLHVTLTGILIRDHEELAEVMSGDTEWAFHGCLDLLNFAAPQDCYEMARDLFFKDKAEHWDLKRFGRLYGVVQVRPPCCPMSSFHVAHPYGRSIRSVASLPSPMGATVWGSSRVPPSSTMPVSPTL